KVLDEETDAKPIDIVEALADINADYGDIVEILSLEMDRDYHNIACVLEEYMGTDYTSIAKVLFKTSLGVNLDTR
ncbi:unnamed protein product, partial [marine sediment metagenome]